MFDSNAANILTFIGASVLIWRAGASLSFCVDAISNKTDMGKAFAGVLFLGGATSLPEVTTSVTAASNGLAELAGSNILGGVAMQVTVLAIVDGLAVKKRALTSMSPKSALIMQGVTLILMSSLALLAISAEEFGSFWNIGLWPVVLVLFYVGTLRIAYRYENSPQWEPIEDPDVSPGRTKGEKTETEKELERKSLKELWARFALMALFVFIGGYFATKSAEEMITSFGIGESFIGATLLALATSLPEVTTSWAAAKVGAFSMAVGGILGTNALEIALFFPADLFYREGPLLNELSMNSIFLGALGILLTAIYLWGVLERRDKTIFNFGIDSAIIIITYLLGMIAYSLI